MARQGFKTKVGGGEKGQMALFVALLFQILFVFFAMIINVGLLVHDKINLQNSVDLGAIYAAQKQAEMLNVIAHTNYQMRQSWKLMSWRLWVLGNLGRSTHPASADSMKMKPQPEAPDPGVGPGGEVPNFCLSNALWKETDGKDENLCKNFGPSAKYPIKLPVSNVIAPFNPISLVTKNIVEQMGKVFQKKCENYGPLNFMMASGTYIHFKWEQEYRRKLINEFAAALSKQKDDFLDIRGDSVLQGVRETIYRNLTRSNRARLDLNKDIKLFNSMGEREPREWLPVIALNVAIPYMDFRFSSECKGSIRYVNPKIMIDNPNPNGSVNHPYYASNVQNLGDINSNLWDPLTTDNPQFPSVGVEKNPWILTYVGISVRSSSQLPFAPFGKPVSLVAKAFAQPFGGRVGPWYGSKWGRDDNRSSGPKTDELLTTRETGGLGSQPDTADIPNYSKYPGDKLGLRSKMALGALSTMFFSPATKQLSFYESYSFLLKDIDGNPERDAVAWVPNSPTPIFNREYEIAAVMPDLFDITYYSIDPNFILSYGSTLGIKPKDNLPLWGDIGARKSANLENFSIKNQIDSYGKPSKIPAWVKYIVRDWRHLLTSWAQQGAVEYGFPSTFGTCSQPDLHEKQPNLAHPGSCLTGGRTGYSVKIISKDYISNPLDLGGVGGAPIRNLPPEDF